MLFYIINSILFQANRPQLERVYRGQVRVLTDEPFVPDPGSIFHMQEIIMMVMKMRTMVTTVMKMRTMVTMVMEIRTMVTMVMKMVTLVTLLMTMTVKVDF